MDVPSPRSEGEDAVHCRHRHFGGLEFEVPGHDGAGAHHSQPHRVSARSFQELNQRLQVEPVDSNPIDFNNLVAGAEARAPRGRPFRSLKDDESAWLDVED